MKITSIRGPAASGGASGVQRPGGAGFSLSGMGAAAEAEAVSHAEALGGLVSVGALLALQELDDPLQRRRRAVSRAGKILDGLDSLKIALLGGDGAAGAARELLVAVREARARADDPRLQGVLDEIETRAAVELAKLEQARAA